MKKILIALGILVGAFVVVVAVAVMTFDLNKHKKEIEAALSKEIGRAVRLGGDIHAGLSSHGLTLSVSDVSFANPSWASRADMAGVKLFELKVDVLALLSHRIDIGGLSIEGADILLESKDPQHRNWDMSVASAPAAKTAGGPSTNVEAPVSINITSLSIQNSRIGIMGADGKVTVFKADSLKLASDDKGISLDFSGSLNAIPITLAASTSAETLMSKKARPVDINLTFGKDSLAAKGTVDIADEKAQFDTYTLTGGDSSLTGHMIAAWGGIRPQAKGTLTGARITPGDFAIEEPATSDAKPAVAAPKTARQHAFDETPLPLDGLKSADADFEVAIGGLPAGSVEITNLKTRLILKDGHLFLSPMSMNVGAGTITGQINLDAGMSPAKLGVTLAIHDVDLSDLIKAGGAEAFLAGKIQADLNLVGSGNSQHELASNLSGTVSLIGAGGDVITAASDEISAGIAEILSPGSSAGRNMNCLVARFIALNGVVKGNGILIDTSSATAAGYGDVDLRSETLNMDFYGKPKLVDLGGLLPPLHIGGTLLNPKVSASPQSIIQNVGNLLTGGSVSDPVPDLVTQQGQNACAYTLDHHAASAPAEKQGAVQELAGKVAPLLRGLFGKQQ